MKAHFSLHSPATADVFEDLTLPTLHLYPHSDQFSMATVDIFGIAHQWLVVYKVWDTLERFSPAAMP